MEIFDNEKADTKKIIILLYKRRGLILFATIMGLVAAVLITFFIPPKYSATGVLYPSSSDSGNTFLENPRFGDAMEANQLLQIMESERLLEEVSKKHDLVAYYKIDTTNRNWKQQLDHAFRQEVSFYRSKYMSVIISATSRDPQRSADLVNSVMEMSGELQAAMFRKNMDAEFQYIESNYLAKEKLVHALLDSIHLIKDSKDVIKIRLENSYQLEKIQLAELKNDYEKARISYNTPFPRNYVIERASPSFKKSSPSFLRNAITGTFAALLFACLWILFSEQFSGLMTETSEK